MKLKILIILFIIIATQAYGQNVFNSNELHYSFIIPENWEIITQETINNYLKFFQQSVGQNKNTIDSGIQIIKNYNNIAYMLMNHHDNIMSWEELIESLNEFETIENIKNDLTKEYDLIKLLTSKAYYVDNIKKLIIYAFESNFLGLEKQVTLMILFLGKTNIIQFNLNYYLSKEKEYFNDVYTIINSFKFDTGYDYK